MTNYRTSSIRKYLADLGSDLPAPGGGSAAAVSSALGVSLLLMVANFTKDNRSYRRVRKDILRAIRELLSVRKGLERLIDEDVLAYGKLSVCFKLAKSDASRKARLEAALKRAALVPCEICLLSCRALLTALLLLRKGNTNLITDVGCGAYLLKSGFDSAVLNVRVNLKYIKDKRFVKKVAGDLRINNRSAKVIVRLIEKGMNKYL